MKASHVIVSYRIITTSSRSISSILLQYFEACSYSYVLYSVRPPTWLSQDSRTSAAPVPMI